MNENINVEIFNGKSKKDEKPYKALKVTIGDWDQLIFVKSKFELDYIEKQLEG